MPLSVQQWRWDVGFYPLSHRGQSRADYAPTFEQARAGFEAAWQEYLPHRTEVDFAEHRRFRPIEMLLRHSVDDHQRR